MLTINPVTSAPPADPSTSNSGTPPAPTRPKVTSGDSVQISNAAQAAAQAVQEATETPAQTAKEAAAGDPQAQRLLAREAAAKAQP